MTPPEQPSRSATREPPRGAIRVAVLASGGGSNLQAIIDHCARAGAACPMRIVLVASDRAAAGALAKARTHAIPAAVITEPANGAALATLLDAHGAELVALAGYLKLVPPEVTRRWTGRLVNIHPSLLPKFGGAGMYGRRVHDAVLAAGESESGATVHYVDDEIDGGAVIAQARVPVEAGDTRDTLAARVLAAEHRLYPRTLDQLAASMIHQGASGLHHHSHS